MPAEVCRHDPAHFILEEIEAGTNQTQRQQQPTESHSSCLQDDSITKPHSYVSKQIEAVDSQILSEIREIGCHFDIGKRPRPGEHCELVDGKLWTSDESECEQ